MELRFPFESFAVSRAEESDIENGSTEQAIFPRDHLIVDPPGRASARLRAFRGCSGAERDVQYRFPEAGIVPRERIPSPTCRPPVRTPSAPRAPAALGAKKPTARSSTRRWPCW